MVTAVLWKGLIKSKSWLTGFQCRPQEEKFLFCAYFIARKNTKAMVSSNFFLWLVYLGPLVCPRTIICQGYHFYHIKKIENTKLPGLDFNEKVCKFLSQYLTNEFQRNFHQSFKIGCSTRHNFFVNFWLLVMVKTQKHWNLDTGIASHSL